MKKWKSPLLLLMTAMIWGFAFVAQKFGANDLGNFSFNGIRFLLGGISLIPVVLIFDKSGWDKKQLIATLGAGGICGLVLFSASTLQQYGIIYTDSASTSGFLTGIYNVFVPILGFLVFRKKTSLPAWIGVMLACGGLYFLSSPSKDSTVSAASYSIGVLLLLIGAIFWAVHILVIDGSVKNISPLKFAMTQFLVCGVLSLICAFIFEPQYITSFSAMKAASIPVLYCGLMSVGVAYTCQILGQKGCDPTVAAVLLSTESMFSAIGGTVIDHENLGGLGYIGCALIFAGILVAQIQPKRTHD